MAERGDIGARAVRPGLLTRLAAAATAAAAALVVAACIVPPPGTQGDPAAPILVRGTVHDTDGTPVAGAGLQLSVLDHANADVGERVPTVYIEHFAAGLDGTFAIHLAPTPVLTAFAAKNGGWVNFDLIALRPDTSLITPWGFPREIAGNGWAGEVPTVVLAPLGSGPNNPPGVPAPLPAET